MLSCASLRMSVVELASRSPIALSRLRAARLLGVLASVARAGAESKTSFAAAVEHRRVVDCRHRDRASRPRRVIFIGLDGADWSAARRLHGRAA